MRIVSFIEDDVTIKKILMHLGLWAGRRQGLLLAHASRMPSNHDPPSGEKDRIALHIQPLRSFEWWEAVNRVSCDEDYDDSIVQMPYEDEYSQPGCLGEQWSEA